MLLIFDERHDNAFVGRNLTLLDVCNSSWQNYIFHQREWRRSSSTLSLEEASDLQAVVDHALAARLHSVESK